MGWILFPTAILTDTMIPIGLTGHLWLVLGAEQYSGNLEEGEQKHWSYSLIAEMGENTSRGISPQPQ